MNHDITSYLKAVSLSPKQGYIPKQTSNILGLKDVSGVQYVRPGIYEKIYFPTEVKGITYQTFISQLSSWFREKKHPHSELAIMGLMPILMMIASKLKYGEKILSKLESFLTTSELLIEFPLKGIFSEGSTITRLPFVDIGPLDHERLKSKIKNNTKSDFWELFIQDVGLKDEHLKSIISFNQSHESIIVLNIVKLIVEKMIQPDQVNLLCDLYFESYSQEMERYFWMDFDKSMEVSLAYGGAYYDRRIFKEFNVGKGIMIFVFTKIAASDINGWVIPLIPQMISLEIAAKTEPNSLNKYIESYTESMQKGQSGYSHLIEILVKGISDGTKMLYEQNYGNALMHYWITLDTILNPSERTESNNLKNRVASLISYKFNRSHIDQYYRMKELYELRNKFVHSGNAPAPRLVEELRDICLHVLEVMLRMHENDIKFEEMGIDFWLADLDKISDLGHNRSKPDRDLLMNAGIIEMEDD